MRVKNVKVKISKYYSTEGITPELQRKVSRSKGSKAENVIMSRIGSIFGYVPYRYSLNLCYVFLTLSIRLNLNSKLAAG